MLFESVAYAQTAAPAGAQNPLMSFLPLIVIFIVFYFLLIRPQQKRQKEHQAMLDAIKAGDRVITNGGLVGTVSTVLENGSFMIEIASGVKIEVVKGGVASKIMPTEATSNVVSK